MKIRALVCALALAGASGAQGATVDGTLVTNVATATFSTTFVPAPGSGYSVSYASTAMVLVQDPCVELQKFADPSEQAPGQVVTFTIWVVNCSLSGSLFNIWIQDQLPANTSYKAPSFASSGGWINYYTTDNWGTLPAGEPPDGTPDNGVTWLGWWLSAIPINASAYVEFQVTVQ